MSIVDTREYSAALKERGYRMTPQRQMVLEAVLESEAHISAETIYSRVRSRYPQVNISTVYRTLELLRDLGLVTQTDMGEGRLLYHAADKGHHHHLVCQKCGAVTEMDESFLAPLQEAILRQHGFAAHIPHLAIFGRCRSCQR